jgi:hypothetical protein
MQASKIDKDSQAVQESNPKPSDLVMVNWREIECDDTLREFKQVLRFDLVDRKGEPLRVQLLLDRRHKLNRAMSKPVAYFRMTSTQQLLNLANTALAAAVTLAYSEQRILEPSQDQIRDVLKAHWQMAQPDVIVGVDAMLRELRLHRMTQERL